MCCTHRMAMACKQFFFFILLVWLCEKKIEKIFQREYININFVLHTSHVHSVVELAFHSTITLAM